MVASLLSLVTAELVRDALPDDVTLRAMGEHRLKDLYRPEPVFQVVHPRLASEFPALNSLDAHPHNLPVQPTPFIGRDEFLGEIGQALQREEVRLLVAFLRALANPDDSVSLFYLVASEVYGMPEGDLLRLNHYARRKTRPLLEVLRGLPENEDLASVSGRTRWRASSPMSSAPSRTTTSSRSRIASSSRKRSRACSPGSIRTRRS